VHNVRFVRFIEHNMRFTVNTTKNALFIFHTLFFYSSKHERD